MKSKKRATSKPSKQAHRGAEASCKQLGEDFLAELEASWRRHGGETLKRIRDEDAIAAHEPWLGVNDRERLLA
jgi:hypothetical protein